MMEEVCCVSACYMCCVHTRQLRALSWSAGGRVNTERLRDWEGGGRREERGLLWSDLIHILMS